jgi:hypothetical protein
VGFVLSDSSINKVVRAAMIPNKNDTYIRTSGGLFVAWPLAVPSQWGDWAFVEVLARKDSSCKSKMATALQIVPMRVLTPEEIWGLKSRPLLFWGMKVANAHWALVMCRPCGAGGQSTLMSTGDFDPKRSIGV